MLRKLSMTSWLMEKETNPATTWRFAAVTTGADICYHRLRSY
jgi:hypothetical protein